MVSNMLSKRKKTIIFSILGIIVIGVSIGYYLYNKGPLCVKCADGKKVASEILYKNFSTDSTYAKKEYTDKILEVTGIVTQVSKNQQNQAIILLKTNESGASVNCTLEGPADKVRDRDAVIIKGICTGLGAGDADLGILGDVYLTRCYVVK